MATPPPYAPDPDRYAGFESGTTFRRCGRSGLDLPAISLGLWHNFGDDRAPGHPARHPAPRLRPRRHPLRPGQQLRAALRQRRGQLRHALRRRTSARTATSWSSPPRPATTCGPARTGRAAARASTCSPASTSRCAGWAWTTSTSSTATGFDPDDPARGDDGRARHRRPLRARRCTPASPPTRPGAHPRGRARSCASWARRC